MIGLPNPGTFTAGSAVGLTIISFRTRSKPLRLPLCPGLLKPMDSESAASQTVAEPVSAVLQVTVEPPMSMTPPSSAG